MENLVSVFQSANAISIVLSALCLFLSLIIAVVYLLHKEDRGGIGKVLGSFLVVSLAFFANNAAVYALCIFIIATFITRLDFLENLAAIFWGRREFWEYRIAARGITTEESEAKIREEILVEPELTKEFGQPPEGITKALEAKKEVINAFISYGFFQEDQITPEVRVEYGRGKRYLLDAVAHGTHTDYLIEIKLGHLESTTYDAVRKIDSCIDVYKEMIRRRGVEIDVKGIVVRPATTSERDRTPIETVECWTPRVAVFIYSFMEGKFHDVTFIREWLDHG